MTYNIYLYKNGTKDFSFRTVEAKSLNGAKRIASRKISDSLSYIKIEDCENNVLAIRSKVTPKGCHTKRWQPWETF